MRESEYYAAIERLGRIVHEAVRLACGQAGRGSADISIRSSGFAAASGSAAPAFAAHTSAAPAALRLAAEADNIAGQIMRALAADFITPIERGDLSAVTLSLRRAAGAASDFRPGELGKVSGLAPACLELAVTIENFSRMLGGLRKKKPVPSAAAYFSASTENKRAGAENRYQRASFCAEYRLYDSLCMCCETIITAAMNNI